jgi:hypothetical protein
MHCKSSLFPSNFMPKSSIQPCTTAFTLYTSSLCKSGGMQIPTSLLGLMRCRYPLPLKLVYLVENSLSFNHNHLNISCPDIPCVLENSVGGAARSTQPVTLCIMVNITPPNLYSSLPSIPTEDHVLPQKKLLYRDAFSSPLPNIFFPCRITKPSSLRLAMPYHRVGKRFCLLIPVLLSIRPMKP